MEDEQKTVNKEMGEIRINYMDRFDDLKENNSSHFSELKDLISKIVVQVEKQANYCQLVQENKKNHNNIT